MKRITFLMTAILFAVTLTSACAEGAADAKTPVTRGAGRGNGAGRGAGYGAGGGAGGGNFSPGAGTETDDQTQLEAILSSIKPTDLTAAERDALVYMTDEEKLARDVYAKLYSVWNLPVFNNISASEQQHLDSLTAMLARYGLEDTISALPAGQFASPDMKALHDSLVRSGSASLGAALTVGATIEDLDIADLQKAIADTDNDDLKIAYQNLMKGSRNHMRSFYGQIENQGNDYRAQYITAEYLARILQLNRETAVIDDPDYVL